MNSSAPNGRAVASGVAVAGKGVCSCCAMELPNGRAVASGVAAAGKGVCSCCAMELVAEHCEVVMGIAHTGAMGAAAAEILGQHPGESSRVKSMDGRVSNARYPRFCNLLCLRKCRPCGAARA